MINDILNQCSKLAQKEYKTRHDWKLRIKLKYVQTNKWYMHDPESDIENETHELRWNFEIQTYHLISASGANLIIVKKKKKKKKRNYWIVVFAVPAEVRINLKESEKNNKYLDPAREQKKLSKIKMTMILI